MRKDDLQKLTPKDKVNGGGRKQRVTNLTRTEERGIVKCENWLKIARCIHESVEVHFCFIVDFFQIMGKQFF